MTTGSTGHIHLHAFEQDGAEKETKYHSLVETCFFNNEN